MTDQPTSRESAPRDHVLLTAALIAFDPEHPRYTDNLATRAAGVIALRRLAAAEQEDQPTSRESALREAAEDVRASHAPNEWDSCVACRKPWPCDAELLAELVMTRAALAATPPEPNRCRCTADIDLAAGPVCTACGHRDHGRSGCGAEMTR